MGRLVDLGQKQPTNPGSSPFLSWDTDKAELLEDQKGQQTVEDMEPYLFCQVVGQRLARPSYCTFQLLESGTMGLSPEAAKPETAPMLKAVGQDQARPATICHLTLANLDQRGSQQLRSKCSNDTHLWEWKNPQRLRQEPGGRGSILPTATE